MKNTFFMVQVCVGPTFSSRGVSDSRFKFVLISSALSLATFTAGLGKALVFPKLFSFFSYPGGLIYQFKTNPSEVFNAYWKSTYFRPVDPLENRILMETIFGIIASGVMSFFLLLASKFSNLESDLSRFQTMKFGFLFLIKRSQDVNIMISRFQIYKRMKKDFRAFNAADKPEELDILEFLIWDQNVDQTMTNNDIRVFNFLFNPNSDASFLDWHPLQNVDVNQVENVMADCRKLFLFQFHNRRIPPGQQYFAVQWMRETVKTFERS